ncbi:MAG: hypothetical protein JSR54_04380, partial [Proteobacteria bacterium]|nr:hypothetical protein [Pseudomonadota bacterium]
LDYARRVGAARPALAPLVGELAEAYVRARYLPGAVPADTERVAALARALRAALRRARR